MWRIIYTCRIEEKKYKRVWDKMHGKSKCGKNKLLLRYIYDIWQILDVKQSPDVSQSHEI